MPDQEWKPDKPVKRNINEVDVPHPDKRRAKAGQTVKRVITFGWEGRD